MSRVTVIGARIGNSTILSQCRPQLDWTAPVERFANLRGGELCRRRAVEDQELLATLIADVLGDAHEGGAGCGGFSLGAGRCAGADTLQPSAARPPSPGTQPGRYLTWRRRHSLIIADVTCSG
jgi:hypothetical protein